MTFRTYRWFGGLVFGGLLLAARAAWADEDDVPLDPRVVEPGYRLLGILLLAALALFVWYQLRKRALLRSRHDDEPGGKPGGM